MMTNPRVMGSKTYKNNVRMQFIIFCFAGNAAVFRSTDSILMLHPAPRKTGELNEPIYCKTRFSSVLLIKFKKIFSEKIILSLRKATSITGKNEDLVNSSGSFKL
jgi:hypothetical protein